MRRAAVLILITCAAAPSQAQPAEGMAYASGEVDLAATLRVPEGDGPFPAAVLVHGSGSSDRSNPWTSAYAEALVARGVAVLHPDKRGSGESGGDWRTATFEDLARDAVAGFDALRSRPEVDASRVGFIGFSQGGHIVPVAATLAPDAAFVLSVSGSVVPMHEQIGDEIRSMGEREGLSEEDLEAVDELHRLGVRYARTGEGWSAYRARRAHLMAGPLGATETVSGFPERCDAPAWRFLHLIVDFDPLPYWRDLRLPTLFLYGGEDENVDVFKSADVIQTELTPTELPYSLLLFRTNGHALYREDATDFVARWIRDGGAD